MTQPTRQFFQRGIAAKVAPKPPEPPRHKPKPGTVQVELSDGTFRVVSNAYAHRILGSCRAGQIAAVKGQNAFTSETGRKAILKRWRKHPQTRLGIRRGQRLRIAKPYVNHAAMRELYALNPTRGIQYSPALKVWTRTDDLGTRTLSERAALTALGHLSRDNDHVVPIRIVRRVQ